ncbi:HEXXH motif domain-containing protein [Nocardiopsis sp. NPDC006938]|uniref:HEXXH motif domain-containing protein n=1 Tax=Nocardiopsis sp. NPDC006938 TaxID=3364337 RepID=UPI00367F4BAB
MADPVPEPVFDALARGGGGDAAAAHLRAAQFGKHLLLLRRVVDAARGAGHPDADRARDAYDLLARAQELAPARVRPVLRHPGVGVWARRTALSLAGHRPEPPRVSGLAAVAAAAALRGGAEARLEVPADGPTAPLPSLGRALVGTGAGPSGGGRVLFETAGGRAVLRAGRGPEILVPEDPHEDAPGWHALRRLAVEHRGRRLSLLLDDQDPDRMPGADLVARRLGPAELAHWRATLADAWRLLVDHHWTVAAETVGTVVTLTPITSPGGRAHTSATARHAFGNLGLSTPPGATLLALTFAHEVQHAKLTALLDLVELTLPEDGSRFYAPWRPDPRPASGLFQGVYAHLGVAGFWRRHRYTVHGEAAARAHADFAHWRRSTADAAQALADSGRLTPEGKRFLALTDRTLRSWLTEPVPARAEAAAGAAARAHRARWLELHG